MTSRIFTFHNCPGVSRISGLDHRGQRKEAITQYFMYSRGFTLPVIKPYIRTTLPSVDVLLHLIQGLSIKNCFLSQFGLCTIDLISTHPVINMKVAILLSTTAVMSTSVSAALWGLFGTDFTFNTGELSMWIYLLPVDTTNPCRSRLERRGHQAQTAVCANKMYHKQWEPDQISRD